MLSAPAGAHSLAIATVSTAFSAGIPSTFSTRANDIASAPGCVVRRSKRCSATSGSWSLDEDGPEDEEDGGEDGDCGGYECDDEEYDEYGDGWEE